jgi:hypothetical protein
MLKLLLQRHHHFLTTEQLCDAIASAEENQTKKKVPQCIMHQSSRIGIYAPLLVSVQQC